jgi:hypothetical protein
MSHYSLRFPASWWNLVLDPNTRDGAIKRRILAGVDLRTADRSTVDALIRTARKAARDAYALGALQLAGMFELTDTGLLIATTAVHRLILPPETALDLSELMVSYAVRNAGLPLSRSSPPSRTEIIDLPGVGPAGRAIYLEDVDLFGKGWSRTAIMVTLVPVPESNDLLVIASTTPNISLAEAFYDVFDAIGSTLRFATPALAATGA